MNARKSSSKSIKYPAPDFYADSNPAQGMYKIGDVESGVTMILNFKVAQSMQTPFEINEGPGGVAGYSRSKRTTTRFLPTRKT